MSFSIHLSVYIKNGMQLMVSNTKIPTSKYVLIINISATGSRGISSCSP